MRLFFVALLSLFSLTSLGQPPANSWINYAQTYYKFPITESGVYRINYQDLQNAGIPILSIQPNDFQLFARGEEQAIYIPNPSDGSFDSGDYIEFYATPNDGWLDTALYGSRSNQPNPYYSLINDTIYYFLSWSAGNHLRYQEENDINFGNYFASNLVWKESLKSFNSNYYDGKTYDGGATDPFYSPEEGWMDSPLSLGASRNINLELSGYFSGGPQVELDLKLVGASNPSASPDHHFRISSGSFQLDTIFDGYQLINLKIQTSAANFFDGVNPFTIQSVNDLGAVVDRMALAYLKVSFPANLNFQNQSYQEFEVEDNINQSASLLEISNFNGGNQPILYDLSNRKRIRSIQTLSTYKAIVPNGGGRKKCVLLNPTQLKSVSNLRLAGNNGQFTDFDARLSDSSFLILTHPKLYNAATNYAAYRRSAGYSVELIRVTDLYDQFGFGIPHHPLTIRNFISDNLQNGSFPITHLLLLGKSAAVKSFRKNSSLQTFDLVPTIGNPATDNLFLSELNAPDIVPAIPTGRLSVRNPTELSDYLSKLIEYETAPREKWMKEALHFAGGRYEAETRIYENYLNDYALDFKGKAYGGRVRLFRKSSSAPIQTTLADSIRSLINGGVSLMTFFGHASANDGFDISIDTPDKLQNRGRYPLMFANSCFTGNYHQPQSISTGEDYVLEKNKGAIAYIATGNLGYAFYLNQYSRIFYEKFTDEYYGASLAEVMRQTSLELAQANPNVQIDRVALEMSLQGDPALKLNIFELPDYRLSESQLRVLPNEITTENDSFEISIDLENIGRAIDDTVLLTLRRSFPNGSKNDTTYVREIANLFYEREVHFSLPIDPFEDIGNNQFEMIIDPFDQTTELNEMNNRLSFDLLIRSGEIIPVFPYDEAIIGEQGISLFASTAYAFEDERLYVFELDTTPAFNSPFKSNYATASEGGLLEWPAKDLASMADSVVYYWRVSKEPQPGEAYNWKMHSFQYIANRSGWGQSDFEQISANELFFLEAEPISQRLEFTDNVKELYIYTKSSPSISETFAIRYSVDADVRERNACGPQAGFLIAVLDSLSLDSWETPYDGANQDRYYGQANSDNYCGGDRQRSEKYFLFRQTDGAQMDTLRNFLLNEIPDGNYIVAYSWQNIDYSQIDQRDPSILGAFRQLGSQLIDSLQDDEPFIFTVKKGDPSSVMEVKGFSSTDDIEMSRTLVTSANYGEVIANAAGGSKQWGKMAYRFERTEFSDSVDLELIGLNGTSQNSLFQTKSFATDSVIDIPAAANSFKQLRYALRLKDSAQQTAPQIDFWHLYYEILPDLSFAPNYFRNIPSDSLASGENFLFEIAFVNPTNAVTDSVLIQYRLEANNGQAIMSDELIYRPLLPFDYDTLSLNLPTAALSGNYRLFLELNPDQSQPEQNNFNNRAEYFFKVSGDNQNPLLDVTFDGRRIMNRELVSAEPTILIQLEDENQFLALDDTSSFSIFLRKPNGQESLINFDQNNRLEFTPASLPDNKAKVMYQPELNEDGIYQLRIQARDKSGNVSSQTDYAIEFEVINRSTVSYLLNYPNPFSTSTRFVFTLTGSKVPDQIQIQIMTITGKVVKEIDQFELGPIHIGKNITDYAWDGKDEYGDQLANGVYLYTVKMRIDGNNIEHRNSAADKYFTKEFGKMYLLR